MEQILGVYPIDMKHYDLLIIGGGVLGVFHAYHALNRKALQYATLAR